MRALVICSACGSAAVCPRLRSGEPTANASQTEAPSHCSNINCPNSAKNTKLARHWYHNAAPDKGRPN
jgi:hypothetical protein